MKVYKHCYMLCGGRNSNSPDTGSRAIAIPAPTIASGALQVQRAVDAEHVLWHFETSSFARGMALETGVNLIPNGRTEANCTNEDCWDLLSKFG